jgi:hypothetical protein
MLITSLIILSLVVSFLLVKFVEKVLYIFLILLGLFFLGIAILPFNSELSAQVIGTSIGLFLCIGLVLAFSGLISAIIITPITLLWIGIKGLFK